MWNRRAVLLAIHLMSLILLGLGWFLDVLTVRVSVSMAFFGVSMMDETRSVMTTLEKTLGNFQLLPIFSHSVIWDHRPHRKNIFTISCDPFSSPGRRDHKEIHRPYQQMGNG